MVILNFFPHSHLSSRARLSPTKPYSCSGKCRYKLPPKVSPSLSVYNSHQNQPFFSSHSANQNVAAIVFGDGSESPLYPLTKRRSEGAIPLAANYRLIDAVVSNCINSNISKIYALTQFNSTSLNSHISRAYSTSGVGKEAFIEVIAAYQSPEHQNWFQGSADAVRRCLWLLEENPVSEFLVLPGHHLYKMDYQKVIEAHRSCKADISVAVLSSKRNHDPCFGNVRVDSTNKVLEIKGASKLDSAVQNSGHSNNPFYRNFSSMGIYVVNRDTMIKLLHEYFPEANDLDSEVLPSAISTSMKVQAYLFDGYWEDMRNIKAYYQANMDCTKQRNTGYNLYDRDTPVFTLPRSLPPTLIRNAIITDSVIGDGCVINKCRIKGTVIGMRTRIEDGAQIEDSIILGSDTYRRRDARVSNGLETVPIVIGKDTIIRKAIVDENARIGNNVMIINKGNVQEGGSEADGFIISGGIVVVIRDAVIPDCTII